MNTSTPLTFVLVHGSWHGAWCWRRVQPLLHQAGFDSHAITLTGVGERRHLLSAQVCLQTHVDDVVHMIESEELSRVVLVGHSYGGLVITAAALALAHRLPGVLQHLVFVDAHTPRHGESWFDLMEPATAAARVTLGQTVGGGVFLPAPDAAVFGLDGADREWVNRRQTPQPFGVFQSKVQTDDALIAATPRTFIDCVNPMLDLLAVSRARVKADPSWRYRAMDTGHDPMVSAPEALAALLVEAAHA
jgi:pimeloyl-ACP methyl ester carboxylesterase